MPRDHELLWIAREGVRAPLPAPWDAVRSGEHEYFVNRETGESMWEHPCDGEYMRLARVEQERLARRARARAAARDDEPSRENDERSDIASLAEPRGDPAPREPRRSGGSRFLCCFGLKPARDDENAGPGASPRPPILRDNRSSPRLYEGDLVEFFDERTEAWYGAARLLPVPPQLREAARLDACEFAGTRPNLFSCKRAARVTCASTKRAACRRTSRTRARVTLNSLRCVLQTAEDHARPA